ncbi:MAG: HAMP domain-containing protein [Proteobacteria bacterium]|jgi:two-component system osmolarity sensor histidine kinase EnvZ|nr:HAMP domain-containing protein [Pseudomonadota bacterium]
MSEASDFHLDPLPTSTTARAELGDSLLGQLDFGRPRRWGFSLFWRTFFLLALLLVAISFGWYQLFRKLEYEPRAIDNARQVASLVNLARAALVHADAIARVSLIKTLADQEKVRIVPREPADRFDLFQNSPLERRLTSELVIRLGRDTVVAGQVNQEPGLWIGFSIEGDSYWLLMDRSRVNVPLGGRTWAWWLATLMVLSILGAALLARLINHPLKRLSVAAARVREGDYLMSRLDESVMSSEVREVNIGFNLMAEQLSRIEQQRAEMLAGISHDLRTPLARLRLETEMSVPDPEAREHMAADIAQVDAIIDKFLDYARPDHVNLMPVPLAELTRAYVQPFTVRDDMQVQINMPPDLMVMADEVELGRVMSNLLENARRYGKTPGTGSTRVRIAATVRDEWVTLRVRDHGHGVPEQLLPELTRPFFRGDVARTAATGAGLGLALVAKMVQNMGGTLALGNSPSGGLLAVIRLRQATERQAAAGGSKRRGGGF